MNYIEEQLIGLHLLRSTRYLKALRLIFITGSWTHTPNEFQLGTGYRSNILWFTTTVQLKSVFNEIEQCRNISITCECVATSSQMKI